MKYIVVLTILIFPMFLNASETIEDILVPYDEDGFYGGSIILMFLISLIPIICIGFFFMLLFGIGGLIAFFFFPEIIEEFKLLMKLYDTMEFKKAFIKHSIHFLVYTPIVLAILYVIYTLFEVSYWYLFSLFIFLYSSFLGFYIFLYFIMTIYLKNWKKMFIALFLGGGVFLFFASSGYFVFEPIYTLYMKNK